MVEVSFEVICLSHKLNADSVTWLNRDSTQIKLTLIDERHLEIRSKIKELQTSEIQDATFKSYRYLWTWLMCMNIGGTAHFDFARKDIGGRILNAYLKGGGGVPLFVSVSQRSHLETTDLLFDEIDSKQAGLCFIAASRERETWILDEYVKGLYHYGSSFYGIDFWKEAFANFYRIFEYFVTRRILAKGKLSNEVKEVERALTQGGIPDLIIEMFAKEVYRIRSNQVMHAQAEQKEIGPEEAGKAKLLCDVAMLTTYRSAWRKNLGPAGLPPQDAPG